MNKISSPVSFILIIVSSLLAVSCANPITKAANKVKYSAYEMVGIEKRDLFKREVAYIKEEQEKTGENFKDALERLKDLYDFDGGNLEKQYNSLKDAYDDSKNKAGDVSGSIKKLDNVAQDLFKEWKKEISEISASDLRSKSKSKLKETQSRYQSLHNQLVKSEKKMNPVLSKLKDQVLYLKHNLNAEAISGLKAEGDKIQTDIATLIKEMNESIKQAEEFIATM